MAKMTQISADGSILGFGAWQAPHPRPHTTREALLLPKLLPGHPQQTQPRTELQCTAHRGGFTKIKSPRGTATAATAAKSLQSCLTLCDPMDWSQPGSSAHGTSQARILEWVAMPSSGGSSRPRDRTCVSYVSCIDRQVLYH